MRWKKFEHYPTKKAALAAANLLRKEIQLNEKCLVKFKIKKEKYLGIQGYRVYYYCQKIPYYYHLRKFYLKQLKKLPKKAEPNNKITRMGVAAARKITNVKI